MTLIQKSSLEYDLLSKVEPVVESMGLRLRDIDVIGSDRSPTIRVYLEKPANREADITLEDCTDVHHALGPMFDVWDPVPSGYTLEVSSAGERPNLRLLRHFEAAIGKTVEIETTDALPVAPPAKPRRRWKGTLLSVNAELGVATVQDEQLQQDLPLSKIRTAKSIREWNLAKQTEKQNSASPKKSWAPNPKKLAKRKEKSSAHSNKSEE